MRRFQVALITILASLVLAIGLSGTQWILLLDVLVRATLPMALWIAACLGWGWIVLRGAVKQADEGVLMHVTAFALGSGVISILQMLIAWAGLISIGTSLALCLPALVLLLPLRDETRRSALKTYWTDKCGSAAMLILLAIPAGIALVAACTLPGVLWGDEPHGYDVLTYHLLVPRQWYEAGAMTPMPGNAFSFFPFSIEMHFLWAMSVSRSALGGMYLAQLLHLLLIFATPVAVYGIVRPKGRAVAASASVMCGMTPWIALLAGVAYDEAALLLYGTLAFAWTIWGQKPRELLVAGLLAGIACGGKYTAVPMVLLPCVLIALWRCTRLTTHPIQLRSAAVMLIAAVVTVSPWLVRNVVWTGNPVFPLAANVLGHGQFSPEQIERWNTAHSPTEAQKTLAGRGKAFYEQILRDGKFGYGIIAISLVAGIVVQASSLLRKMQAGSLHHNGEAAAHWIIIAIVICCVWISATHLQGRFAVLLVPIAAIVLGLSKFWPAPTLAAVVSIPILLAGTLQRLKPEAIGPDAATLAEAGLTMQKDALAILPADGSLILVGDSMPLWYTLPTSRVRYTSVFNLPADASDLVTAYLGDAKDTDVAIINRSELERLHRTYRNLPSVPAIPGEAPIVIMRIGELRERIR